MVFLTMRFHYHKRTKYANEDVNWIALLVKLKIILTFVIVYTKLC